MASRYRLRDYNDELESWVVAKPPQVQASEFAMWTDHLPSKGPAGADLVKMELEIDTEREELNKREFANDLVTGKFGPIACAM